MEWRTDSENEEMGEEPYSSFKKGGSEMMGEKTKVPFIIIGGGVLVLILLFFIFNPSPPDKTSRDFTSMASRLNALEKRVVDLEGLKKSALETGQPESVVSPGGLEYQQLVNWIKSNSEVISETIKKMGLLQKQINRIQGRAQIKTVKTRQPAAAGKQKVSKVKPPEAPQKPAKVRAAGQSVKPRYHTVKKGENLYRISLKYGITVKRLQQMNRMGSRTTISPGQRLVVGEARINH